MWSNVISPSSPTSEFTGEFQNQSDPPPTRYKHSSTLHSPAGSNEHYLYVYGGRSGTFALKDLWELDLNTGIWREIKPPSTNSDTAWPPRLQEHTLVSANNRLYMFGGECHHNSDTNSHVWVWCKEHEDIGWEKIRFKQNSNNFGDKSTGLLKKSQSGVVPVMRRGHSAVVCEVEGIGTSIVIFGGYRDLKGSLGDCWAYGVNTNTWALLSSHNANSSGNSSSSSSSSNSFWTNILNYWTGGNSSTANSSTSYTNLIQSNGYYKHDSNSGGGGPHPQPRHNHSAVYYNNKMYVYGGMCDLVELSDFWVFELETRRWSQIKCLFGPGVLKGHGSCVVGNYMYVFGGEGKGGARLDDVWRFDFIGETFERLQFPGCHPCPRVFATATKLPRRRPKRTQPSQSKESSQPPSQPSFVKKSTSTVRFADTQTIHYSQNDSVSTTTTPVLPQTPSCSDYSSMETINYVENPNYKCESIEMRLMGGADTNGGGCGGFKYGAVKKHRVSSQHPEYVLVVGGLETHKSAVFSKRDLVVWRLRVDCFCNDDEDDDEDMRRDMNDGDYHHGRMAGGSFSRERSAELSPPDCPDSDKSQMK